MRHIFLVIPLILSLNLDAETAVGGSIKVALEQVKNFLDNDKPVDKNPLHPFNFEKYKSRSYLYYYRAAVHARLAKSQPQKLQHLDSALLDLAHARLSTSYDQQRIDILTTEVIKEKIEVVHGVKNYQEVIDAIDHLPQKEKSEDRNILYYANALFNMSKIDDFKNLVRNYLSLFKDEKTVKIHLKSPPKWNDIIATIVEHKSAQPMIISPMNTVVKYSKEMILNDPDAAFNHLKKDTYFSCAEDIFKMSSSLYFAAYKKSSLSSRERKFVRTFQRQMHSFAPTFIDNLISSHWQQTELRAAEMLSDSFLARYQGHPLVPKVLFNLGRIQEDSKNYQRAAKTYKDFLAKSDDATYAELARFRLSWVLYLGNRGKEARSHFDEYLKYYPEGRYASTSEYFILKIDREKNGRVSQERIESFIKKYPFNLFAFLIVDEFGLSDNIIRQTLPSEANLSDFEKLHEFKATVKILGQLNIYRELLGLGLKQDAITVLKNFPYDQNNEIFTLYLASQFQDLQDTHGEVTNLIKAVSNFHTYREFIPWKNLFPSFRKQFIDRELAAQKSTVSPLLVLSLIRQESTFNPNAKSPANAFGLMQLTPGTANDTAKQMRMQDFSLLNEEDNLKLGIGTFTRLLKKYNNRVDYALCAYNAGETPTQLWIKLRGHLEPIKFIESIPYKETRIYVKSILRNYAIYRMLDEAKPTPLVSYNEPILNHTN